MQIPYTNLNIATTTTGSKHQALYMYKTISTTLFKTFLALKGSKTMENENGHWSHVAKGPAMPTAHLHYIFVLINIHGLFILSNVCDLVTQTTPWQQLEIAV